MSIIDKVNVGGTTYDVQDSNAVRFNAAQTLTVPQLVTARENIKAEIASAERIIPTTLGYIPSNGSLPQYIDCDASGDPIATTQGVSTIVYICLPCAEGDKFTVYPKIAAGTSRPMLFLGAYNESTGKREVTGIPSAASSTSTAPVVLSVITAPEDTDMVVIQGTINQFTKETAVYYKGALTQTRVDALTSAVEAITPVTVEVSGNTPSITALANHRYVCTGTAITAINFTPCASGVCELSFSSNTADILTVSSGTVMPDWWTATEAGRTYEMSFLDKYGVVMSWATPS